MPLPAARYWSSERFGPANSTGPLGPHRQPPHRPESDSEVFPAGPVCGCCCSNAKGPVYGQDTVKIRTLRNKVRYLSILRADRTRIPRTTYSRACSSALLIHQDLPALAGPAVALCTNFARILSVSDPTPIRRSYERLLRTQEIAGMRTESF